MDLEYILYRIIDGYYTITIDNVLYKIKSPSISMRHKACLIYKSIIEDNKYDTDSWVTCTTIERLQSIYGIWTKKHEDELSNIYKSICKHKIDLYLNYQNVSKTKFTKKQLISIEQSYNKLLGQKHYFDHLTLEYYAQNIKNQFLILNMIYDIDDNKIFKDYDNIYNMDLNFIEKIIIELNENTLSINDIKKLARHELWKSIWNVSKSEIFNSSNKDLTDDQRSLISFSKVLDSIKEHPEAPNEDIINDDDALDGWILYQNDKQEKEKAKQHIDNKYGLSNKNAGEIFIVTNDQAERKSIYELNDTQTNQDIKNMIELTNHRGQINWIDLPHVKRNLQQQSRK